MLQAIRKRPTSIIFVSPTMLAENPLDYGISLVAGALLFLSPALL